MIVRHNTMAYFNIRFVIATHNKSTTWDKLNEIDLLFPLFESYVILIKGFK